MSLETELHTLLSTVCPRVYPDVAPLTTAKPYITWQQVGGSVLRPLAKEVTEKRNARIQVNAWATTRAAAIDLMLDIEQVLVEAEDLIVVQQGAAIAAYSEEDDLRGMFQLFSIWANR